MSFWKTILEKEVNELKNMHWTKLNVIQQRVADKCYRRGLTIYESKLVIKSLNEKTIQSEKLSNVIFEIANFFICEKLTNLEVTMILLGIDNKEMLNEYNSKKFYKEKYGKLLSVEGIAI